LRLTNSPRSGIGLVRRPDAALQRRVVLRLAEGAYDVALVLQIAEIAADRDRRDAELGAQILDTRLAVAAYQSNDRQPAFECAAAFGLHFVFANERYF